jgi:adenosine kinase
MDEAKMFIKLNKKCILTEEEINKSKDYKMIFEEIHKLLKPKKRFIVVTSGTEGVFCSVFDYENSQMEFIFQNFPKFIEQKNIVDFNGAGDSFLGGFLSQLIQGKNMNECCKIGNRAAGVVIRNVGCSFDMFNEKVV